LVGATVGCGDTVGVGDDEDTGIGDDGEVEGVGVGVELATPKTAPILVCVADQLNITS